MIYSPKHFLTTNINAFRRFNPNPNLAALSAQYGDLDVVADLKGFADAATFDYNPNSTHSG